MVLADCFRFLAIFHPSSSAFQVVNPLEVCGRTGDLDPSGGAFLEGLRLIEGGRPLRGAALGVRLRCFVGCLFLLQFFLVEML